MIYLQIACIVLALADGYLTWDVIRKGKGREGNPVLAWIMGKIGLLPALVLTRIVVFAAVLLVPETSYVLAPLFAYAVFHNYRNL